MKKAKGAKDMGKKHATNKKSSNLPKPKESALNFNALESLKNAYQAEYEKKQLRREIRGNFQLLTKSKSIDLSEIAQFLQKYAEYIDILKEALSDRKNENNYYSRVVWSYLLGEKQRDLENEILVQKIIEDRKNWIELTLPTPLKYQIALNLSGPIPITAEVLQSYVSSILDSYNEKVEIRGNFPFKNEGEYPIIIVFSDGIEVTHNVCFSYVQVALPESILNQLQKSESIQINDEENTLVIIKNLLDEESPTDILNYYPVLGNVLYTAYKYGYWKTEWVQAKFLEWQKRKEEYNLNVRISQLKSVIDEINRDVNFISPDDDDDGLEKNKLEGFALDLLRKKREFPEANISVQCSELEIVDKSTISVEVKLENALIGRLIFNRTSLYLPRLIREELLDSNIPTLLNRIIAIKNTDEMLVIAEAETRNSFDYPIESEDPMKTTRSKYLAVICHALIVKGHIGSFQFKRTLTSFYAARGQELLEESPLQARNYLLLFYWMIFKEHINDHLKAVKPSDYPVFANFISTFITDDNLLKRSPRDTDIRGLKEIKPQISLLWRSAQLIFESPLQFYSAFLEMFTIDDNFIRELLSNLRRCQRIDRYSLEYLNPDNIASNFLNDIVKFSLNNAPVKIQVSILVDFMLSLLDAKDTAQPIINSFIKIIESSRLFIGTKDIVRRYTLYTEIDKEYLQTKTSLDRLVTEYRGNPEGRKRIGRILRMLTVTRDYINVIHRDFFSSAKLEAFVEPTTLPKNQTSPVEIIIQNTDFGLASNVVIKIERDSRFLLETYEKLVSPYFAGEKRIEYVNITPLTNQSIELTGNIIYTDQEGAKSCIFRQALNVSDPDEFMPFISPYITGDPVRRTEMFFGRRMELDSLITLLQGQNKVIAVWGQRRIGKTSLLLQLQNGDPTLLGIPSLTQIRSSHIAVYIDFERFTQTTGIWEIYYKIYTEIFRKITNDDLFAVNEITIDDFMNLPADSLLDEFIYKVITGFKASGKKLLLLMDEFDNLVRIGGEEKGIFGTIRELIIKYNQEISFVFVGADEFIDMMMKHANRLYSMANILNIPNLNEEEAKKLIIEPMQKRNPLFEWPDNAVRLIINFTDRHPYYIQVFCDDIVNSLIVGKRLRVTTVDVENVAYYLATNQNAELYGELSKMTLSLKAPARAVLAAIANITKGEQLDKMWVTSGSIEQEIQKYTEKFTLSSIIGILRELQLKNILIFRGNGDSEMEFGFRVPLLRLHVIEYLKIRDLLREWEYI